MSQAYVAPLDDGLYPVIDPAIIYVIAYFNDKQDAEQFVGWWNSRSDPSDRGGLRDAVVNAARKNMALRCLPDDDGLTARIARSDMGLQQALAVLDGHPPQSVEVVK